MRCFLLIGSFLTVLMAMGPLAHAQQLPLALLQDVPLPGGTSRFDYESVDQENHLLFIAHLGANSIIAFDTRARRVVGVIPDVPSVHGVLVVPQMHRVYASATGTNQVVVIDEGDRRVLARIPGGEYPDGMAYDPIVHKLYVSDEFGRTETVINPSTNTRVHTIDLGGEAGNSQFNPLDGNIYVDVQTRNELVVIDPLTDRIVQRYSIPSSCERDHSLLMDPADRVAFVACEGNAKLAVFDLKKHRFWPTVFSVGGGPNVLAFDPVLKRLYVASESGVVTVFLLKKSVIYKLGQAYVAYRAHSVAVDPQTHWVYLPLQNVKGRVILRIMKAL